MTKEQKKLRNEFVTPTFRKKMIEECGAICINCESENEIEYHHIVPIVNGGSNRLSNIVAICSQCHAKAHDKTYKKSLNAGRKTIITNEFWENAKPHLERYYNSVIGTKECKTLIGISQQSRSLWTEITKKYEKEQGIKPCRYFNKIDINNSQEKRLLSRA